MTKEQAEQLADYMEAHHPCFHVHMIANGVGLLKERGLPIPAWTVPNRSWVVLWRHDGESGVEVMAFESDWAIEQALVKAGYIHSDSAPRDEMATWVAFDEWRCPIHEHEDSAA